jgi:hypothetical protein
MVPVWIFVHELKSRYIQYNIFFVEIFRINRIKCVIVNTMMLQFFHYIILYVFLNNEIYYCSV